MHELFLSTFSHMRTEYGEILCISSYAVRMRENADENNSEYEHFSRSVNHSRPQNSKVFEYGFSLKKIIF